MRSFDVHRRLLRGGLLLGSIVLLVILARSISLDAEEDEEPTAASAGGAVLAVRQNGPPGPLSDGHDSQRAPLAQTEAESTSPEVLRTAEATAEHQMIPVLCVDAEAEPVPGCVVEARGAPDGEILAEKFTNAAGRVLLEVPESPIYVLRAEQPEKASSGDRTLHRFELEALQRDNEGALLLSLHPYVLLRGRVRWESGSGIAGAHVHVRNAGISLGKSALSNVEAVTAGFDGEFEIQVEGIPTRAVVEVSHGPLRPKSRTVELPDGASEQLEFVFHDQEYTISGTVRLPAGSKPERALVVLRRMEPEKPLWAEETDGNGAFSFGIEGPGEYLLAARSGSHLCAAPVSVSITEAHRSAFVELFLPKTASIRGRIQNDEGKPLTNVPVGGIPESGPSQDAWLLDPGFGRISGTDLVRTDSHGEFRLDGLHQDYLYVLVCTPDEDRPECLVYERGVQPNSTSIVIVVDETRLRGGVLSGTAVRGNERAPVPGLSLFVRERWMGRSEWTGTREKILKTEDGRFVMEGLVIGNEYFMEARIAKCAPLQVGPWIASEEEERVDLVFGLDGELRVTVVNATGESTRNWVIALVRDEEGPQQPIRLRPQGEDGVVHLKPLVEGRYRLSARREDTIVGPIHLEILANRVTETRLEVGME